MVSELKQIVLSALRNRVGPDTLSDIDTLIQRSLIALQRDDVLPPRTWEFTSSTEKQEKRLGSGDLVYNFYYLPEDFRKLDEFRPYKSFPYRWVGNQHDIFQNVDSELTQGQLEKLSKRFTIVDNNFDEKSKYEKILIALPFPDDDEVIRIRYYVNGKNVDWNWVGAEYWEAVISHVEKLLGLRSPQEVDDEIGRATSQWKEQKGHNTNNKTNTTLAGSYFGRRRSRLTPFDTNIRRGETN